jgi:hypothetical protein
LKALAFARQIGIILAIKWRVQGRIMDNGRGKIRLEDLARIAGVSVATVSRALNDSPAVNRVTKRRVWKIARDHSYVLNHDMPLSMSGSQATIAIVIPPPHGREGRFSDPFYQEMISAVGEAARDMGWKRRATWAATCCCPT